MSDERDDTLHDLVKSEYLHETGAAFLGSVCQRDQFVTHVSDERHETLDDLIKSDYLHKSGAALLEALSVRMPDLSDEMTVSACCQQTPFEAAYQQFPVKMKNLSDGCNRIRVRAYTSTVSIQSTSGFSIESIRGCCQLLIGPGVVLTGFCRRSGSDTVWTRSTPTALIS